MAIVDLINGGKINVISVNSRGKVKEVKYDINQTFTDLPTLIKLCINLK